MAIKHENISVSAVKHGSVKVSQVDHWNITVFASYAVTISAGTGVNSVFLSTNQNALSGSPSGTKFITGTTVYAFAVINTAGYKERTGWSYVGNGNIFRIAQATVNSACNFGTVSAETVSGPCTVKCASNIIGLQRVYLSASSKAHFGSSKLNVTPGTEVYGFAVLDTDTYARAVSGWTLISGTALKQGAIYRVGSKRPTSASAGYITTYYINLVGDAYDKSAVLFTRSGESVGSWTVKNHGMQVGEQFNWATFSKSGSSIYGSYAGPGGEDVNNELLGTFNCPAGYTVNLTLIDRDGKSVVWNKPDDPLNGPYVIDAETTAKSSQS